MRGIGEGRRGRRGRGGDRETGAKLEAPRCDGMLMRAHESKRPWPRAAIRGLRAV